MKKIFFVLAILAIAHNSNSQNETGKRLKKVLQLKITREGGANAAGVAWHPIQKKYYAAMAGNADFQMGVYDPSGKILHQPEQQTFFDVRGFWYNPHTKTLQANGYNEFGWAEFKLDTKGMPVSIKPLYENVMYQPDEQSIGAYDPQYNAVYFFNADGNISKHNYKEGFYDSEIPLHLGYTSQTEMDDDGVVENSAVKDNYNSTAIIFTGIKGSEIGLLNYVSSQIELYNIKTGFLAKKILLPDEAPVSEWHNFSYCNGIYWLFDTKARIWKGYK